MEPLFAAKNLEFGGFLSYQDITIPHEKVTFITGESGSGKSSLLKLLNKTQSPSFGSVYYNNQNIAELNTLSLRRDVSLVSQEVFLFDSSIRQNFASFYQYRGLASPDDSFINEFLRLCCLDFNMEKQVQTMSGGERQRLYIAVFLSFLPKVLLLDEPTSALDIKNGYAVLSNIIYFCKSKNIDLVIVSHNKDLTDSFSEYTLPLKRQVNT